MKAEKIASLDLGNIVVFRPEECCAAAQFTVTDRVSVVWRENHILHTFLPTTAISTESVALNSDSNSPETKYIFLSLFNFV